MSDLPKILISTRFSFFGQSGWKSEFSADPKKLFDENRLEQRFWLFENITLPSLASQTDKDFHYFVLSSTQLPEWAKEKLNNLCERHIGLGNFTIRFARGGRARKFQMLMLSALAGDDPVAQVVLDDDDALASDFIATLKSQLQILDPSTLESCPHFVTYPVGYALGLREGNTCLWEQSYRFINLGLTMIGPSSPKNIFGIDHLGAPPRFGFTNDSTKPMYIRTLSNVNDSRVAVGNRWTELTNWMAADDIQTRFKFLIGLAFEDYHKMLLGSNVAAIQYGQLDTN